MHFSFFGLYTTETRLCLTHRWVSRQAEKHDCQIVLFSECSILSQELAFTVTACFFLSFCLGVYEQFPDLRHTFATVALQSGVDVKTVSAMLGHYDAGFTLRTYTHTSRRMQEKAAEKMGNFMAQVL